MIVLEPQGIPIPNPFHWFSNPVGSLLGALAGALTAGVQALGSWAFDHMTTALVATTQVRLDGWFSGPWRAMVAVAGMLALPILLAGVASEVLAGRPSGALRRGVLLPLAIAPALLAARAVLGLVLALVNAACAAVVELGVGGSDGFAESLDHMRGLLGISASPLNPGGGAATTLFVVLIAALLSFVIWIELACRAALVLLLVAFVPLALAGLFWSATARWTRRLLETLLAVVLAQLVITVLMVLAAAALRDPGDGLAAGIDGVAVGLALLFLGSLGLPLTFRIIPHVVEAAAVAGAGAAVTSRLRSGGSQLMTAAPSSAARLAGATSLSAVARPPAVATQAPVPRPTASALREPRDAATGPGGGA